jgi:uncharacterized protein (DUF2252 family)
VRSRSLPPVDRNNVLDDYSDLATASKPEQHSSNITEIRTSNEHLPTGSNLRAKQTLSTRLIRGRLDDQLTARGLKTKNRLGRDPQSAVSFIRTFNSQLNLKPDALAAKYALMKRDPFTLFRAMPALFYTDLNGRYSGRTALLDRPAPRIMISGDVHLQNFGTFRGENKHAVWGINDFDQASKGSPEWDLERLAVSAVLAARSAGLGERAEKELVEDIARKYFDTVYDIVEGRESGPAYLSKSGADGPVKDLVAEADNKKRKDFLEKYITTTETGKSRFISTDEIRPITAEEAKPILAGLASYERRLGSFEKVERPLRILDVAEKIGSGGSSFGLPRYYALVANSQANKEPIIIELKQVLPSSIDNQSGDLSRADSRAIVERQQALGGYVNPLTGYTKIGKGSFLVRELEPEKSSISIDKLKGKKEYEQLVEQAARVLARSHAQSPKQALAIADWINGEEKRAEKRLVDFARTYADQVEADYKALVS